MYTKRSIISLCVLLAVVIIGCGKDPSTPANNQPQLVNVALYGDTVFYLNGQNTQVINPVGSARGVYAGFPQGLDINTSTGAINLATSESGLKYFVTFVPENSVDTQYTFITISGLNFTDGFYNLNNGDTIAQPIYNAAKVNVPGADDKSQFDVGGGCNDNGCNVLPGDGKINLAQTVRNGIFGADPQNGISKEFEFEYKLDDKSGRSKNKFKIKLFYFKTQADVTQEATDIINSRQGTFLAASASAVPSAALRQKAAKPRPSCIFIVGH